MKLAAEKNLNKFSFPLFSIKGRKIVNPCSASYSTFGFRLDQGEFGPKNLMVMDILGTLIIHTAYNFRNGKAEFIHKIPTQNDGRVKKASGLGFSYKLLRYLAKRMNPEGIIPESLYGPDVDLRDIDPSNSRIKKVHVLTFTDSYLKEQIPFLEKYSSNQLHEMIRKTSECSVRMNFPVRFFDGKGYQNFSFNNYNFPCRLFTLLPVVNSKVSSDGQILERRYQVKFDTFLGYFFFQNCLSCYVDLLPDKFYSMSDYAQLFYRMLVLPYFNNVKNPIGIEEIRKRLALKTKDTYMVRKVVKRVLEELETNGFIKEPKEERLNAKYSYAYTKNRWKEINKWLEMPSGSDLVDLECSFGNFEKSKVLIWFWILQLHNIYLGFPLINKK
jgi:predicted transcriptional regulator